MPQIPIDPSGWSLRELIGQMLIVRACGHLFDHQIRYPAWEAPNAKLQDWLQRLNLGGVILLGGSACELATRTQQLQTWAPTPLLIAADIEEGVGQRFSGATWFPPPLALGAIAARDLALACHYSTQMGAITAQEALSIGINWLLGPVVDINNNPDNPVINVRAFAETSDRVATLTAAFIAGAKSYPILTTAKHFPGHGDTATDSHLELPVVPHSPERLAAVELIPFQQAIQAGVDSVMSAHLLVPAWDNQRAATLSPAILTGQLRQKLGFEGLIVTDALIMGGVANYATPAEIAVQSVEAGADLLLMPPDPGAAIAAIEAAVHERRLSLERIQQSVTRILAAKTKVCTPTTSPFWFELAQPSALATVDAILQASQRQGGTRPVPPQKSDRGRNLLLADSAFNSDYLGRHTPAVSLPQHLGYQPQLVDDQWPLNLDLTPPTLLQVFLRGSPFRGNLCLKEQTQEWLKELLQSPALVGLIVYGDPHAVFWFQSQIFPELSWVFTYGQMPQAQDLACRSLLNMSGSFDISADIFS